MHTSDCPICGQHYHDLDKHVAYAHFATRAPGMAYPLLPVCWCGFSAPSYIMPDHFAAFGGVRQHYFDCMMGVLDG